jgi:hypothetical protein
LSLDPTQDYYDIKSPVKAPIDWMYWIEAHLDLRSPCSTLFWQSILWLWLRKRKAKKEVVFVDTRTPAQRAKENLQALLDEARVWQSR